jgi:hypothetical protein
MSLVSGACARTLPDPMRAAMKRASQTYLKFRVPLPCPSWRGAVSSPSPTGRAWLFSLSLRERVGVRGSEYSMHVFDLIPLILTFSRREKGLADLLNWFCTALEM